MRDNPDIDALGDWVLEREPIDWHNLLIKRWLFPLSTRFNDWVKLMRGGYTPFEFWINFTAIYVNGGLG